MCTKASLSYGKVQTCPFMSICIVYDIKWSLTSAARIHSGINPGAPWHHCTSLSPEALPMDDGKLPFVNRWLNSQLMVGFTKHFISMILMYGRACENNVTSLKIVIVSLNVINVDYWRWWWRFLILNLIHTYYYSIFYIIIIHLKKSRVP